MGVEQCGTGGAVWKEMISRQFAKRGRVHGLRASVPILECTYLRSNFIFPSVNTARTPPATPPPHPIPPTTRTTFALTSQEVFLLVDACCTVCKTSFGTSSLKLLVEKACLEKGCFLDRS